MMPWVRLALVAGTLSACLEPPATPPRSNDAVVRRIMPPRSRAVAGDFSALEAPPSAYPAREAPGVNAVGKVLANGVEILVCERGQLPFVETMVIVDRGAGDAGGTFAGLAAWGMLGSSAHYTRSETIHQGSVIGSRLYATMSNDYVGLRYATERSLFFQLFDHALYGVSEPELPSDEAKTNRDDYLAGRAVRMSHPFAAASETLVGLVLGKDHPYAALPRLDDTTNANVVAFRDQNIAPDRIAVLVAGQMEPGRVFREVERTLGSLKPRVTVPRPPPQPPVLPKARLYVIDRPGSAQAVLGIGYPGVSALAPEAAALRVLTARFASGIRSLLGHELREVQGKTYGVSGRAQLLRQAGLVSLVFATPEVDAPAAARRVLELVAGAGPLLADDDELAEARRSAHREVLGTPSTNGEALETLAWIRGLGVPYDAPRKWGAQIEAMTPETARAVASRYLRREHAQVVVIGDRAKLEGPLRAALPDFEWLP